MTKPEPLKGKEEEFNKGVINYKVKGFKSNDVKSALEWMIAIHEERIEELIIEYKKNCDTIDLEGTKYSLLKNGKYILNKIQTEYEAIMILEEGLSDVI